MRKFVVTALLFLFCHCANGFIGARPPDRGGRTSTHKPLDWNQVLPLTISIVVAAIGSSSSIAVIVRRLKKAEKKEIDEEVSKVRTIVANQKDDVLKLMMNNVSELNVYYVINRLHARRSFAAALTACILGFLLFALGLILYYFRQGDNIPLFTTVGGAIVEVVAGLFFWLYNKCIQQLRIYHSALQKTERFLTGIHLVDKVSEEKKDEAYKMIIASIVQYMDATIDDTQNSK